MTDKNELYFEDPLLKLGVGTRLWAKSLRSIVNTVVLVSGALMAFSDVAAVFWVGVLFLVYVLSRMGRRWGWWGKVRSFHGGNLIKYMKPESRGLVEAASDRSAILGGSFLLHLLRELADVPEVEEILSRLGIERSEFAGHVDRYIQEEKKLRETRAWRVARAEEVVVKALTTQIGYKRPITPKDLFRGLMYTENERVRRIFNLFGITPKAVGGQEPV
jgi:hypothetical protein